MLIVKATRSSSHNASTLNLRKLEKQVTFSTNSGILVCFKPSLLHSACLTSIFCCSIMWLCLRYLLHLTFSVSVLQWLECYFHVSMCTAFMQNSLPLLFLFFWCCFYYFVRNNLVALLDARSIVVDLRFKFDFHDIPDFSTWRQRGMRKSSSSPEIICHSHPEGRCGKTGKC